MLPDKFGMKFAWEFVATDVSEVKERNDFDNYMLSQIYIRAVKKLNL